MGFSVRKKKINEKTFLAYFKKKSQSKDENDGSQIINVLTSLTENVTSAQLAYAEEEMQKTYQRPRKHQVEIPARKKELRKKLACMQKMLVLLQQLKRSILNI